MLKTPTIPLQSMQAESMIQAARQYAEAHGKDAVEQTKRHFQKTALAFFKTTNDAYINSSKVKMDELKFIHDPKKPNFITNAIIAFSTELRKAEKECPTIVRKPSKSPWDRIFTNGQSVKEFIIERVEDARIDNPELNKQILIFETIMSVLHPKTYEQRLNIAHSGLVRADGVYKPTTMDKIRVNLNRFINLFD